MLIGELGHDPHLHEFSMQEFFHFSDFQFLNAVMSTFLNLKKYVSASAASLVYNPFDLLRSCMPNPIDNDMLLLASLFGSNKSKPSAPKPAGKRRASPLKDPPIPSDDDDESSASDYVMGEINEEKKPKPDRPEEEDIPMERQTMIEIPTAMKTRSPRIHLSRNGQGRRQCPCSLRRRH